MFGAAQRLCSEQCHSSWRVLPDAVPNRADSFELIQTGTLKKEATKQHDIVFLLVFSE